MLLRVDLTSRLTTRVQGQNLKTFGLDERQFQDILFHTLERVLPDDELLLLMQSRRWREEPDLIALDKQGRLCIFELKAWESQPENLLQVLRYGQIYGTYGYEDLDRLFRRFDPTGISLLEAHRRRFQVDLTEDQFNQNQVFVVMTNGLDHQTREAIQYWHSRGLDVRPWVYRVYRGESESMLVEISRFAVTDDPYEDLAEGYYILNTNYSNDPKDHDDMMNGRKAAAYFDPWKKKIEHLSRSDVVFLYRSGVGIVAFGKASGRLQKLPYQGKPEHPEEEYAMELEQFQMVDPPVPASEIKEVTGINYRFMSTMFAMDAESGGKLQAHIAHKSRSTNVV